MDSWCNYLPTVHNIKSNDNDGRGAAYGFFVLQGGEMIPTAKLRWIDRLYGVGVLPADREGMYVRVLQQWWTSVEVFSDVHEYGEWRDVPLKEET